MSIASYLKAVFYTLFLLFGFSAGFCQSNTWPSGYPSERITSLDGLSEDVPTCFLKDSQGFMWIGTERGLNRYDGYGFKKYYHRENDSLSLSKDHINCLYEDSNGMIWIGTMQGGLNRFDPLSETFSRYPAAANDRFHLKNSEVFALCEDNQGDIWFAAHLPEKQSVYKINQRTEEISCIEYDPIDPHQPLQIHSHYMIKDMMGNMWVGFEMGILKYDTILDSFEPFLIEAANKNPYCQEGMVIYEDRKGMLWIGTYGGGLYRLNNNTGQLDRINQDIEDPDSYNSLFIPSITGDDHDNLYIRSEKGIEVINSNTGKVTRISYPLNEYRRDYTIDKSLYLDPSGLLWLGANKKSGMPPGVYKVYLSEKKFSHFSQEQLNTQDLANNWISSICQESGGKLWVGGSPMGISWKPTTQSSRDFQQVILDKRNDQPPIFMSVSAIHFDSSGRLWIGSWGDGNLYMSDSSGFNTFEIPDHYKIQTFRNQPYATDQQFLRMDDYPFSGAGSMRIHELRDGRLLIARGTGLDLFYPGSGEFRTVDLCPDSILNHDLPVISSIAEDESGSIWIGTMHLGLYKITPPFISSSSGRVLPQNMKSYKFDNDTPKNLGELMITSLCIPEKNESIEIWIGTHGGGLFGLSENSFKQLTMENGLAHNVIYGILEDEQGNLWLSTENGLSRYSVKAREFRNYTEIDGIPVQRFHWQSYYKGNDGSMFFGGRNGLLYFHPDSVQDNPAIPPVVITEFRIFNKPVPIGGDSPLEKSISRTRKLELAYKENFVSFEFASLNFIATEKNRYRYLLEGIDQEWIEADSRRLASYSNLRHGRYKFKVIGSNNDGIWNTTGRTLQFRIHPPPWLTWWAYSIYVILCVALILWYRSYLMSRARLRTSYEFEKMEKERALDLDQMKSRFFSNISHEFRTPLTLILGPINDMLKDSDQKANSDKALLVTMKRNTERLQELINQLLDLSKLESGKMKLTVSKGDLTDFIRAIVSFFKSLAEIKNIQIEYDLADTSGTVLFDKDKVEKIVTNLVSNALKFTQAGGLTKITLSFENGTNNPNHLFAEIRIQDNGRGIPIDDQDKIFDRFYQLNTKDSDNKEGTGIGLALTKELIQLYRGSISVESTPGKGSVFTVTLPVSADLFSSDEIVGSKDYNKVLADESDLENVENETVNQEIDHAKESSENDLMVLVVEDNEDLRNYMAQTLGNKYQMLEAENGSLGLNMAYDYIPDLVISDLMMPEMDGIEFCERMRNDQRTNHIPLIILTARADRDSKIEGLEAGADDYILKPFDGEELNIRVRNLIEQRQRLREKYRNEIITENLDSESSAHGDPFIDNIQDIILVHISDPEFSVEELGKQIGLSRTQLYRKTMAIIDMSPSELIRSARLKLAARLFREKHRNVSDVMYSVGFNSHSSFAAYFREMYGKNPREYIKQHSTKES